MAILPTCQHCGKKLYHKYGTRGHYSTACDGWTHKHYKSFDTEEECRKYVSNLPEGFSIRENWEFGISYGKKTTKKHALFCTQYCTYEWLQDNRENLIKFMKDNGSYKEDK